MKQKIEIWKPVMIKPFIGMYEVSNFGRVKKFARIVETPNHIRGKRRYRKEFILKPVLINGYMSVTLCEFGEVRKHIKVHRLVALHFLNNPKKYPQINHIDGNKLNNHCSNLEWCNQEHNMQHAHAMGLMNLKRGSEIHSAKLDEAKVKIIRRSLSVLINKLSKQFDVGYSAIHEVIYNKTWRHIK